MPRRSGSGHNIPTVLMSCTFRCPEAASESPAPVPTPSAFAT